MRRDRLLLHELLEAGDRIIELTNGMTLESLEENRTIREALLWSYTVLGEATGRLSNELKGRYGEIPWRSPLSLRNRIVHGYWQVSTSILLVTAEDDLPAFLAAVRGVLTDIEREE